MKRSNILFYAATLLFVLAACNRPIKGKNGVVYDNAIAYNDYIINRQTELLKVILQVSDELKTDPATADITLNKAVALIDKDIIEIGGMPEWKGNTSLRDNALSLFQFYKVAFGSDYRRMIAIQKDGEVTTEEETELKQLAAKMDESEGPMDTKFQKAQMDFSSQNNIRVEKNEIQDKIDQMGK